MSHIKLTMFSASSLAGTECAETVYAILSGWDFPPSAYDEYEPIRADWRDKGGFLDAWNKQSQRHFGQVLIQRKGRFGYMADSVFQFGPGAGYHGISIYRMKESECSSLRLGAVVRLGDELFERLCMDYAFICSTDEYDRKNIVKNFRHADGAVEPRKVIGMNWPHCLPGIYWTNYFGPRQLDQGFGSGLSESGPARSVRIGGGIRIQKLRFPARIRGRASVHTRRNIKKRTRRLLVFQQR